MTNIAGSRDGVSAALDGLQTVSKTGWLGRVALRLVVIAVAYGVTRWILTETDTLRQEVFDFFFATLAAAVVVVEVPAVGAALAGVANSFAGWLARQGAFRSDPVAEAPKFALLRIGFGFFMALRATYIVVFMYPTDWQDPWLVAAIFANLAASLMVTFGLGTQLALAFLLLVQWQPFEQVTGTSTLGNDIGGMFALLLLFANAGAHFSADAWLRKRGGVVGRIFSTGYAANGLVSANMLQIAKFLALTSYWAVCMYSLMRHLSEPAWMEGIAGPLLLTNNFMSEPFRLFEWFFELGPWAVFLGRISLWLMLPWYLTVMPAVLLGGIFRKYVIGWGILFFLLSLFALQLGSLAVFEFLFFAALFWQKAFIVGPRTLQLAYDDRCNLCDRTVNFVKTVDVFRRVELRPLTQNRDWLKQQGIDPKSALIDLYGVETDRSDRQSKGYDLYIALSRRILVLTPVLPFLLLGKALWIGPAIYRFVADRRTKIFGVCEVPTPKPEHEILPKGAIVPARIDRADVIVPAALHLTFLLLAYLIAIPAPFAGWNGVPLPDAVKPWANDATDAAHLYGVAPIDVFNLTDLRMAENWFTLSSVDKAGAEHLLPLLAPDGGRLVMHLSDRVYFGYTLRFRRATIGHDGCHFEEYSGQMVRAVRGFAGPDVDHFVYRQYFEPLPGRPALLHGIYQPQPTSVVCTTDFTTDRP